MLYRAIRTLPFPVERIQAAGRTDAGVHANGQVVAFSMKKITSPYTNIHIFLILSFLTIYKYFTAKKFRFSLIPDEMQPRVSTVTASQPKKD